ncbi:MAG: hypothetical protein ACOC07_12040 [Coleofasciculus sp.]|uniref:hypothetical protein n=1 Tax=Coleofasciculus sp. TaxID=3100458 RepID=UPI003A252BC8
MNYQTWNNKIASYFFKPEMAGCPVHLYVTEDLIVELGQASGADLQDFIKAVKTGLVGVPGRGICQKARETMEHWQYRCGRRDYPLYIGYLALFVLAAGMEGDFSANAYYPRLRELLGEEPLCGKYPGFDQMRVLWDDLEKWSEDKDAEWGIFNVNIAGKRNHVGLPIAQTLLTEEELKALPVIFAESDLDPTFLPSDQVIALLLAKPGRKHLRNRTLRLLEETNDSNELRQALLERIVDELRNWDGMAELSAEKGKQVHGILRLCCKLDQIAERVTFTLRCTTKQEFPEDHLFLSCDSHSDVFSCYEYGMGWSSPIILESEGRHINASQFDWCQGLRMQDSDQRWCFKLPASPIRLFIKGDSQGLRGLVEVGQLPQGSPFYLAAHQSCCPLIKTWGESSCKGFKKLLITEGLPQGWHFFKVDVALSDELVKRYFPILAWSTNVQLYCQGGIRIDQSNRFFKFAPPKLVINGGNESVKLYCNNFPLDGINSTQVYELPKDVPSGKKLVIEARKEEEVIKRISLVFIEDFIWSYKTPRQQFDQFGHSLNQESNHNNPLGVAGALVSGVNPPAFNFNTLLPIKEKQHILFLGNSPGQVIRWPEEPIPSHWSPIWAIVKGTLFDQAKFCGTSLAESAPLKSPYKDRRKLQQWKEILWHCRKRILPPLEDSRILALWKKFQEEARRV